MSNDNEQRDLFGNIIVDETKNVYLNKSKKTNAQRDLSNKIDIQYVIEIVCVDANEQEAMYNELIKHNFECRVLTL